ncbi:hypothetical protein ACJJTC_010063 [Scirpophaga incertulas]
MILSFVLFIFILASSKVVRPILGVIWQYAKKEMAPPGTTEYLHGPGGKKLEDTVAKTVDGFINSLDNKIKEMDQAELKEKQQKEAALKAAEAKAKAAALAKAQKEK